MELVVTFAILIFSAIVHEVAHGLVAERLGDTTARDQGRITLNPISHIDPVGSILLPVILYLAQRGMPNPIVFGFARPVPVDFENTKNPRLSMALISAAGPLANFLLAAFFAAAFWIGFRNGYVLSAVILNVALATFNLVPIPPLDGSKILASIFGGRLMYRILGLEAYGFLLVLIFLYSGLFERILYPVVYGFLRLFGLTV